MVECRQPCGGGQCDFSVALSLNPFFFFFIDLLILTFFV